MIAKASIDTMPWWGFLVSSFGCQANEELLLENHVITF